MVRQSIEEFLGLREKEIQRRKDELRRRLRTIPGTEYLKTRMKIFKVQPWPLIIYLAHYSPQLLTKALNQYKGYDGAENVEAIKEQLREKYVIGRLFQDIEKEQKEKNKNKV